MDYDNDKQTVQNRIGTIQELCKKVVSTMSDVIWSIDSRNETLNNLIDKMKDFSFQLLNEKNIQMNYSIEVENTEQKININTKQNIYLIFKEAINNIAKHSNAKNVEIIIHSAQNNFEMKIMDDGRGLPEGVNEKGNGLRNMKMRAEKIGGKFEMVSDNGLMIKLTIDKM